MRSGINNLKLTLLLMLIVSFTACAQSDEARLEQSRQMEKQALELRLKKDFRGALEKQLKAVELTPNDSKPLTILAGIYQEIHETENVPEYFQKSKEVLEKAVKLDPNDAVAHNMLADVLEQIGDKRAALRELQESVRLDPENARYLNSLGAIYGLLGDTKKEREFYEKAIVADDNYSSAIYNLALLEKAEGNLDIAVDLFKRSMEVEGASKEAVKRATEKIQETETQKNQVKKN